MIAYSDWSPTGADCRGLALPEQQDWLVAPCSNNRDADTLQRCNWEVMKGLLKECDGDWEMHRFGHWACGWFEIIVVRPGSQAATICQECEDSLSDYPILSDEAFSEAESAEQEETWRRASVRERLRYIERANRGRYEISIFSARRDELPRDENGYLREAML